MTSVRSRSPKHLWLLVYWLAFVWLAIDAGHHPGFVASSEAVSYPIKDVVVLCLILALLVVLLRLVLQPPSAWRPWARVTLRSGYVLLLLVQLPLGLATDMPGIAYVPMKFALLTLVILGLSVLMPRRANKASPSRTTA